MTAPRKPDRGLRGIATGDAFGGLVSRALARTWASIFVEAHSPAWMPWSSRSCTSRQRRIRTSCMVVTLDGRSAYDTVSTAAFPAKLLQLAPALRTTGGGLRARRPASGQPGCPFDLEDLGCGPPSPTAMPHTGHRGARLLSALQGDVPLPCAAARVCHHGYDAPSWPAVSGGAEARTPSLRTR
eukprot:s29_g2.t1